MDDRTYTLEDFAAEVDIEHPLTARRIPVLKDRANMKFHVALVIGGSSWVDEKFWGIEPEEFEIEQLLVYLEKTMRYYNDGYRKIVENRAPFDVDSTVNCATFRKTADHGWQYNKWSWRSGPMWIPDSPTTPLSLEELLDTMHLFGLDGKVYQPWLDLKAESGKFPSQE